MQASSPRTRICRTHCSGVVRHLQPGRCHVDRTFGIKKWNGVVHYVFHRSTAEIAEHAKATGCALCGQIIGVLDSRGLQGPLLRSGVSSMWVGDLCDIFFFETGLI